MIIGVDFDNTIVCYDEVLHKISLRSGFIPKNIPRAKDAIRNYLRKCGKENEWIKLQGIIYGPGILDAEPFAGVLDFFMQCKKNGIKACIISHKTLHPFLGSKHNLHEFAHKWLEKYGFYDPKKIGLSKDEVFFELTKEGKLNRIIEQECTHFIEDLPEFLSEKKFPSGVARILFDPNNQYEGIEGVEHINSWQEMSKKIKKTEKSKMAKGLHSNSAKFKDNVSLLSKKAGFPAKFALRQLEGGRNNRIFCINYEDGGRALLKAYFQHQNDKRARMDTEYSFLNFAWNNNVRCVPKPLSADFKNNLGLYEFIGGRKLSYTEIDKEKINQALDFFTEINKYRGTYEAQKLPAASDACFSLQEHIGHAARRVEKLKRISNSSGADREARIFAHKNLMPEWDKALAHLTKFIQKYNLDAAKPLVQQERCISPSDFGYHNAILGKNNKLYFIDFEYAGFDDPSKMVCDFFCQPEVPVPYDYLNYFANEVAYNIIGSKRSKQFKRCINALLPLYKVKWCCIMLNDFLDTDSERRNFAFGDIGYEEGKINQLDKAKNYLKTR